jgi:hypothetical protein
MMAVTLRFLQHRQWRLIHFIMHIGVRRFAAIWTVKPLSDAQFSSTKSRLGFLTSPQRHQHLHCPRSPLSLCCRHMRREWET